MSAPYPQFIPEAFATGAAAPDRNVIPDAPVTVQRASWQLGFPPKTMTPVAAGGKPMLGPDMNGVLYMMSSHAYYAQTGQPYRYNAAVMAAVAGYAVGTLLGSTDGLTLWLNLTAANTTDPDVNGINTGWVPMFSYGMTVMPPSNGGVVTLTSAQATKSVIVLSGALVANLQVNLPTSTRRWLIINTTTGGFTTTVKTLGGSGVIVGQGGFAAPVEVYGDGTNIYNVVAPTVVPGDVAPTPNTYAVRSNNGYLYATYLNQNSASNENPAIGSVFVESGGDGFLRKATLNYLLSVSGLQNIGGQIQPAQIVAAAVTQFTPLILANAALTGTPTAPTPAVGDNSTKVATTAFVQGTSSIAGNGYMRFPNGIILQWGHAVGAGGPGPIPIVFPLQFPTLPFAAVCSTGNRNSFGAGGSNIVSNLSVFGMNIYVDQNTGGNRDGYWFAVGN